MILVVYPGRKFVSILMRFWYLTSARLPDDTLEGTRVFQVNIGGEGEAETKRLLTANYEWVFHNYCLYIKWILVMWTIFKHLLFITVTDSKGSLLKEYLQTGPLQG